MPKTTKEDAPKEEHGCDVCSCKGFEFERDEEGDRLCFCGHFEDEHNVGAEG
jgi:hypothetical protein